MDIKYEKQGRVALITLNRPQVMNALDQDASRRLADTWIQARQDPDVWVVIVTGSGDKAFCAGADLKQLGEQYAGRAPLPRQRWAEGVPGFGGITRDLEFPKPTIAAVNGYCLAGGLELALACDLRVAAEHATFGLFEARWGLMPTAGGTQRLPRLIPPGVALEMAITGRPIDAARAYEIGLVNAVVPLGQLLPKAEELAQAICANAPLAVRAVKEAMWSGLDLPLSAGLRLEFMLGEAVRATEDVKEGLRAFREKVEPDYKGK